MSEAQISLSRLIEKYKSWIYRSNTIVQAAILAFSEMSEERQKDYLLRIHRKDKRFA